ncbi:MAG: hypothetical protein Ta2A_07200 [Treponemataceae bacterium]|nr:MAG: hypothetical protein Ta2A_07200 [Treponemataceae bacterium]
MRTQFCVAKLPLVLAARPCAAGWFWGRGVAARRVLRAGWGWRVRAALAGSGYRGGKCLAAHYAALVCSFSRMLVVAIAVGCGDAVCFLAPVYIYFF